MVQKCIDIYYVGYVYIKDSKYEKINSVNLFCLIFSKLNEYFKEINGNEYLTLVPANERKGPRIWVTATGLKPTTK